MPDAPGLELIARGLNSMAKGSVIDTSFDREQAALIVDPEHVLEVLSWLRDEPGQEQQCRDVLHGGRHPVSQRPRNREWRALDRGGLSDHRPTPGTWP